MPADHDMLAPGADEAYQLTTDGALRGDTFTILITRTGETVTLNAERDASSVSAGKWSKRLTAAEWGEFLQVLHRSDFWSMAEEGDECGLDGTTWVISGRHGMLCHSAGRWCPHEAAFVELGSTSCGSPALR